MTDEQIKQVKQILSRYDAASLTAEKARAIHDAFREAGLRAGPAMADTIMAAGFDPDKLRDLVPPPDMSGRRSDSPAEVGAKPDAPRGDSTGPPGAYRQHQSRRYSVDQAISDRAQLHMIAFDGVAFLTGEMACNTFLPPGKVADFYEIDGLLSYRRAEVLGSIIRSLTDEQKAYLAKMVFNDSSTWPELEDQVDKKSMSYAAHVAVMTYASEMFSWYAGNVEADVYFCPERHGTYFGSFFIKDILAMGNDDYSISMSLTGDSGEAFLVLLTEGQRKLVTSLVDQQRADLKEIVNVRREIATLLRGFQKQDKVNEGAVMALSRRYGELDGEISYFYAKAFAEVARTLTPVQKKTLMKLRNLDPKYTPEGAFLYSAPLDMPEIPNTDFFFAADTGWTFFRLSSPEVADGGTLPGDYTGDGSAATLPLKWTGAPEGTKSFALIMHHAVPDGTKWCWILYNIPVETTMLPRNAQGGIGTLGSNSVNGRAEYAPPHSKDPGVKTYIYTVYALSEPVTFGATAAEVSRDVLLTAMKGRILATAELKVIYSRNASTDRKAPREDAR